MEIWLENDKILIQARLEHLGSIVVFTLSINLKPFFWDLIQGKALTGVFNLNKNPKSEYSVSRTDDAMTCFGSKFTVSI